MRTRWIILLAGAVAALACTKEAAQEEGVVSKGRTLFTGECISTKIALGDKNGDVYPALWEQGDQIAVYNASTGTLIGTATLADASADAQTGTFVLEQAITDGTSVKVVYPAGSSVLPAEQAKTSPDDKSLIASAESAAVTVSGGAASFTLSHENAVIKVDVSSSEFSGRLLKSVTLYAAGATLAQEADYVRVTYSDPVAISASRPVSAVFSARPLSESKDFYVAVKLVSPADPLDMVTIPKKFTAKTLQEGKVAHIDFTSLATSDNAVAWYNPVCKRYIPEGGWCYGESGTILVPPTANASVQFDVRAVGEFIDVIRYAAEPKSMQLRCGDCVNTGNAGVWTVDGTTPKKKNFAPLKSLSPTILLTAAPKNSKKAVFGLWNLCDANDKTIWSYIFWGATPGETVYDNGTVMNMNLGGSAANGSAAEQRGAYYQWGRPFPFGYGSDLQTVNTALRIKTFQDSAQNTDSIGCIADSNVSTDWWQAEGAHKYDLWGNPSTENTSTGGVKSIFDPCPKGWKVASAAILKEVYEEASYDETNKWYTYKGDVWVPASFYNGNTATRGSDSKGLYWADNALNDNHGLHYEFVNDGSAPIFGGTWRANAASVRCMKDADNR